MADKPFMVLPAQLTGVTSGNARPAAPGSNLGEFLYRGMVWQSAGNGSLWVKGALTAAQLVSYVGMLGALAQPGTTIRVRLGTTSAQVDGTAPYDSGVLPFISPAVSRTDGVYHSHLELPAPITASWWRIDIAGHSGDFQASMLVIGAKLQVAKYYEPTWKTGTRDLGSITFARNGVPGVAPGAKLRAIDYTLGWVSEAEAETMLAPLDDVTGRTVPYLTCFDPAPTIYRQRRTFFGFNEEAPSLGKVAYNQFERNYQLLSLF